MSISSLELWQRIAAEGIASPMQCRSWAAEVAKSLPAADTADGLKVLQKLIDIGKLTKYQAKSLAGQSDDPLKRGAWNVLGRVKVPQWQGWLEVTKIDTSKGEQPPPRWARWLKAEDLDSLRASAPSLPRGIQLAQLRHAHLQSIEMPEMVEGELQLRVEPVRGQSLVELFRDSPPSAEQTQSIIEQVSQALATMHQKQVVHGRVIPDRIFWDPTAGTTLICDPISVWTASVEPSTGGVLGEHLGGLQLASFLAPEFLAPRQPPSLASDVYALGATWWWLLTGKPPVEGKNVAATLGQAAEQTLDFSAQLADLPKPICACLQHCLAKNPSARFPSAVALVSAMEAARNSVARGKITVKRTTATPLAQVPISPASTAASAETVAPIPLASNAEVIAKSPAQKTSATAINAPAPNAPATNAPAINAPKDAPAPSAATPPTKAPASAPTKTSDAATPIQPTAMPATLAEANVVNPTQSPIKPSTSSLSSPTTSKSSPAAKAKSNKPAPQSLAGLPAAESDANAVESKTNSAESNENEQLAIPTSPSSATNSTAATPNSASTNAADDAWVAEAAPLASPEAAPTAQPVLTEPATVSPIASTTNTTTTAPQNSTTVANRTGNKPIKSAPVRRKAKRKSKMPLFVIAGFGFLALVLGILKLSGALDSVGKKEVADTKGTFQAPANTAEPTIIAKDPILEHFRLVDSKDAAWAPPQVPDPIPLDLLPPGAQLYIALRPAELLKGKASAALTTTLSKQFGLDELLKQIAKPTGQPIESISSMTIGFYNAPAPEQFPLFAVRVELSTGVPLQQLKASWGSTGEAVVGDERLHTGENDQAYYVPKDADLSHVRQFSYGPTANMKEVAEANGGTAALNTQFKQLHVRTSKQYQLVMLGSPRYLFNEGRGLKKTLPKRLQDQIEPVLGQDSRAGILQTNIADQWYWELQLLGPSEAESPRITSRLTDSASTAATKVEQWLVEQTPHPYWRALALRFPQMIRTWREYSRFSLENGIAVANGYLPADAASNLVVATWVAAQESSTFAGQLASNNPSSSSNKPAMSPEEILNKPIRLIFDQEPIERALALVGEEANTGVPAENQLRFELDGGAFERAGITRNQQLREYKMDGKLVREALTEIAKRGNPVTTVKDTRELDQRLIWVVRDDPNNPGKKMISLTTRDAATASNIPLSKEFAP